MHTYRKKCGDHIPTVDTQVYAFGEFEVFHSNIIHFLELCCKQIIEIHNIGIQYFEVSNFSPNGKKHSNSARPGPDFPDWTIHSFSKLLNNHEL